MKKIILLLLLLIPLTSCKNTDLSNCLFIASIGFEKGEDKVYRGYFYLPLSSDVGKSENMDKKGKGEYAEVQGDTVAEVFNNVDGAISLDVNLRHLSSIILNVELLNEEFILELVDYIKFSLNIDYNCYLFSTKEKMKDVYSFQNPNQESVLNSFLVSTSEYKNIFLVASPMHFLEFVRKFYADRTIFLPLIELEEIWNVGDEKVKNIHPQSGVYFSKNNVREVIHHRSSPYMKTTNSFYDKIEEETVLFSDYQFDILWQDKPVVDISFKYERFKTGSQISKDILQAFVEKNVLEYIWEFISVDPLDLSYYSEAYEKDYSYESLEIKIKPHRT